MKQAAILLLPFVLAVAETAAQRLDLQSMSTLRRQAIERKAATPSRFKASPAAGRDARVQSAFITIADGYTRADLEAEGIEVSVCRGSIAIATVPVDRAEEISALPCVKAMSLQKAIRPAMDAARADQNIDEIQLGSATTTLPRTYTGKGVCAGIVDQGFDPHHINFRYANGESRIGYCCWKRLNAAGNKVVTDNYNYTNIKDFTTDTPNAYHATHTLGILGGSYNGPVSVGTAWADPTHPEENSPLTQLDVCPYYGVAPEADLSVSCGDLQDAFVAEGVEALLNYRYFMQWPMVINLSLGSTQGPRDPKSQMAQYLDLAGKEAIICMSAGNEGDLKISLTKTFSEGDTKVKSFIHPYYYRYDPEVEGSRSFRNGSIEVWSDDATPFKLKAVIYNKKRGYHEALPMPVVGDNIGTYYTSSADYQVTETDIVGHPTFAKAYEGYVGVGGKIDESTGRYYGMVDYYLANTDANKEDDYIIGFEIEGEPGHRINCYGDGLNTWIESYGVEGFTDGSTDNTINDMAAAHNIIVVGSYNTRQKWLCLDGGTSRYEGDGFIPGHISGFSSYGETSDGRALPTICAPGAAIISSVSWPYAKQLSENDINYSCSAVLDEDGRRNLWKQEVGTSMSTPFVAGSIALWLEANPNLTVDDVKEIIAETAIVDDAVKSSDMRRWGAGKFNALGGLKEAIRRAGINDISVPDNDRLILTAADSRNIYTVFLGEASALNVRVYALDGKRVREFSGEGDELTADLNGLTPGIYIVNVNGRHSAKVSVID